jgi:hypothetical protein
MLFPIVKILGNYSFKAPRGIKMGIYKPKPYFQGGWAKHRKINSSRITRQCT